MCDKGNDSVNLRGRWANDENFININEMIKRTSGGVIERCISLGAVKSEFKELLGEFLIPLPWGLFEAI